MKKISIVIVFVIVIFIALVGCSDKNKEPAEVLGNNDSGKVEQESTETNDGGVKVGGTEINVGKGQSGISLELPAEFPSDTLPLLDDAQINYILKNDSNKGISVTFGTSKNIEEAYEFYKEVMKDGSNTQEISIDSGYLFMGSKGDYVVTISIVDMNGEINIMLDAVPKVQ